MNKFRLKYLAIGATFLIIGVVLGALIFSGDSSQNTNKPVTENADQTWTCSMHPHIRKNEPGDCPICGMDLIPLGEQATGIDPDAIKMSATAMQLADIQTAVVGSTQPVKTVELSGKVQVDERLLFTQSAHIPGRIEQLEVSFTGEYVDRGEIIARVYSPALVTAQEELFEAQKVQATHPELFRAAKEKLKNWKLTDAQIEDILATGSTKEAFPVVANISGYVTKKLINAGDYVKAGQPIFQIADLSKVWLLFNVYESDLPWVDVGDSVKYTIQSLPGRAFSGVIDYVDPTIDPRTRVARARVVTKNPNLKLKPEMFASGQIETRTGGGDTTLVVPKSAVMWTGKRSVVYVKEVAAAATQFQMREVTLGPALGDSYVIESGLEMGEEIAVNGTFSIDAAAQLAGKPSMMGNRKTNETKVIVQQALPYSTAISEELKPMFEAYFQLKDNLVNDDAQGAQTAITQFKQALSAVSISAFKGEAQDLWMNHSVILSDEMENLSGAAPIEKIRTSFFKLSGVMIAAANSYGAGKDEIYVQFCPMADDNQGAYWLSTSTQIRNPYFGSSMLKCGEVQDTIQSN